MTQLEQKLAETIGKLVPGLDLAGIIEAARGPCDHTFGTPPVVVVTPQPPAAEPAKRTRKTAAAEPEKPATILDASGKELLEGKPTPEPEKAPEPDKPIPPATASGIDLTGLIVGTGASKKVVKDVFLAAVEKAKTLAALVALNDVCDCGFATGDYTEETAGVLKRKLNRWGAAQE